MENNKDVFSSYLRNELSGEELKNFIEWLREPANSKQFDDWMEDDWNNFSVHSVHTESTKDLPSKSLPDFSKQTTPNNIRQVVYKVAASILLPIAVGALTYFIFNKLEKDEVAVYNEINVPLGSKTKIQLSDGTTIWLNSGSKLRYPQKFANKAREVELTGEGYFDVTKNEHQPFIVKASDIKIKVLGTSFNVKSYADERSIETTLVKGLITISKNSDSKSNENPLVLKPNQRATYLKDKGKLFLSETEIEKITSSKNSKITAKAPHNVILSTITDTEQFTAWKDEKLIFKNENFESLCVKLERWFNVKINIQNEDLKKYHYTGTIKNETINDVVDILHLTMSFDYNINHSVINIWTNKNHK